MAKRKTKSYARLKRDLDAVFSKWVRVREASTDGFVGCYTCPQRLPVAQMQAGHFISRNYLKTRWDSANVKPQCVRCNIFMGGMYPEFALQLGQDLVAHLVSLKTKPVKFTRADLQEKIDYFKKQLTVHENGNKVST